MPPRRSFTCDGMADGGMNDQLGGGFARYSVDERWLVPHFEKMLYDQAQLVQLYLDAHLISGNPRPAAVARDVLRYVQRDMTHPEGGFFSAEDADSEGKEGKFYCWTLAEFKALSLPRNSPATRYFGVTEGGNFLDHSDPDPLKETKRPEHCSPRLEDAEAAGGIGAQETAGGAVPWCVPHLDDKVLTSWNGMMLGAFARGYGVLGDIEFRDTALRNLAFLQSKLWDPATRTLHSRWRDGHRDSVQLLDAYANLLAGVTDLYEVTLDPAHLQFASDLADAMIARFYDTAAGDSGRLWRTPPISSSAPRTTRRGRAVRQQRRRPRPSAPGRHLRPQGLAHRRRENPPALRAASAPVPHAVPPCSSPSTFRCRSRDGWWWSGTSPAAAPAA